MTAPAPQGIDTVVMSGGAPQSPLMAGFLYEVLKAGKTFRNFHTSGAGALMALLMIAPRGGDPCKALRNWVEAGVADEVYAGLPVNFKLFRKPGPFSPLFHFMAERMKVTRPGAPSATDDPLKTLLAEWLANPGPAPAAQPSDRDALDRFQQRLLGMWTGTRNQALYGQLIGGTDPIKRLRDAWLNSWLKDDDQKRTYNDLVELVFSAMTPSTLTSRSKGLAAPLPFLEELIDFDLAEDFGKKGGHFCVNAYNMTIDAKKIATDAVNWKTLTRDKKNEEVMWLFGSPIVKPIWQDGPLKGDHIRAAFSMPFIYPPARIGDHYFSEGADHQPINFHELQTGGPAKVVLLDVLADLEDILMRTPRDLWDAYVISIMTPVVALAREDIEDFKLEGSKGTHQFDLIQINWTIPPEFKAYVMDWSYTNLKKLFEAGQIAAENFLRKHGSDLPKYEDVFGPPSTARPRPVCP